MLWMLCFRLSLAPLAFHFFMVGPSRMGSSSPAELPCKSKSFSLIDQTVVKKSGVSYFFAIALGRTAWVSSYRGAIGKNWVNCKESAAWDELGLYVLLTTVISPGIILSVVLRCMLRSSHRNMVNKLGTCSSSYPLMISLTVRTVLGPDK